MLTAEIPLKKPVGIDIPDIPGEKGINSKRKWCRICEVQPSRVGHMQVVWCHPPKPRITLQAYNVGVFAVNLQRWRDQPSPQVLLCGSMTNFRSQQKHPGSFFFPDLMGHIMHGIYSMFDIFTVLSCKRMVSCCWGRLATFEHVVAYTDSCRDR